MVRHAQRRKGLAPRQIYEVPEREKTERLCARDGGGCEKLLLDSLRKLKVSFES